MSRNRAMILLLTCLLAPAGCTDPPREQASPLSFGACGDRVDLTGPGLDPDLGTRLEFSCAVLQVPLDHEQPRSGRIGLQVVRIRHRDQGQRIGSLVMNPGGPGHPGLDYAPYWANWLSDEVLTRFDVVTFDPRGTGRSAPINCAATPESGKLSRFPDLLSRSGLAYAQAAGRHQAQACMATLGSRASSFSTEATAVDLDLLRQALGDDRLTYVGFSYGAKLGAEYARRFPGAVRALVLDAPSDPRADWITTVERQAAGFQQAFDRYAADCGARPTCTSIADPHDFVLRLVRRAGAAPIPSFRPGDELPATGTEVIGAVQTLLYDDATWPALDSALTDASSGDSGSLWEALDQVYGGDGSESDTGPDGADAGYVINCNDAPPGPSQAQVRAAAERLVSRYDLFGAYSSWGLIGCRYWPAARHVLRLPEVAATPTSAPVLVIGTRHDPATPYAGAVSLASLLGNATLLTWEGDGHTAFGRSGCIDQQVYAYLVSLAVPARGRSCPASRVWPTGKS